jgi:tetratricopeptide (TPR) repeat protein
MIYASLGLNMYQQIILGVLLLLLVYASVSAATMPPRIVPPLVRMAVPEAKLPIRLSRVDVQTEVLRRMAHTRIEMVFFNPNERPLEGELQFPLLDGQVVSGFALDINGELRSAVPVEKDKGQQVFEDVIRARIDPALLEKTQGNNYKLRVYPLPAHGTRRVVLEIDETLPPGNMAGEAFYTTYRLPLQFADSVEQLDVAVTNPICPVPCQAAAVVAKLGAERIGAGYGIGEAGGSRVKLSRKNYTGKAILSVDYPTGTGSLMTTETRDDQTYFYAETKLPTGKLVARIAPKKLGLVWDASGSGALRDHGKEFALLDAYFKALKNVEVELVLARDRAEAPRTFKIQNGDWHALRAVLEQVAYDGATSVAALSPPQATELNLLFSDGLGNFGNGEFVAGAAPLFAVTASASHDQPRLRAWAERSGGRVLDLLSMSAVKALDELTHRSDRLLRLTSNGAKELVSSSDYAESGQLQIAGILTEPDARVEVVWLDGEGKQHQQAFQVKEEGVATTLAARRWAALKLAQLDTDYAANRAAIRRLGKQFHMVTRETSLIVLDRVEDYVRYEIAPPEAMRADYERLLAMKTADDRAGHKHHLDEVVGKFESKQAWWEKSFPKGDMPKLAAIEDRRSGAVVAMSIPTRSEEGAPRRLMETMSAAPAPVQSVPAPEQTATTASIQLKKWEPDAPYAKRLRQATTDQLYGIYLDERPAYTNSTAFFLDAADIFIERGQLELGLRILSNLVEMNLENRHVLRVLAYRLLQAKQPKLAIPILQRVLEISENEPQSWRDLGLAYEQDRQCQKAVDSLWEVVSRSWDQRFPDIELIALAELNAIIANAPHGTVIDTSRMDARLLRNLPLDIRAVLAWDSDNADIDLWVTDPNGEKVYYSNRLGYQGGSLSRDFTGGYGPEEFSLRAAKPGKYKVQAHFFGNRQQIVSGATTLMLRFSTGFGTAHQRDENVILRLTGQGEDVEVGTFEIGKPQ